MYGSSSAQMGSGLLRYQSAPTSLLGQLCEDLLPPVRPTSPETDTLLARFFSSDLGEDEIHHDKKHILQPPPSSSSAAGGQPPQMVTSSMGMESEHQIKNSHLIRHSSSPAGLFDQNGYRGMRGFRNESEYPMTSWEESALLSESNNFSSDFKRHKTEPQSGEVRNGLSHQFSLPKTSSEMAAIEKFLQFQDSVPCKIRAKRGCATHPRSIAERVRRTRISERMRKLQELVPNMDKQTNTADMLDLAVDYIKDLQKQVKTLSDDRVGCTCSSSK